MKANKFLALIFALAISINMLSAIKLKAKTEITADDVFLTDISSYKGKKIKLKNLLKGQNRIVVNSKFINENYLKNHTVKLKSSQCIIEKKQKLFDEKILIKQATNFIKKQYNFDETVDIKICMLPKIPYDNYKIEFSLDDRYILSKTPRLNISLTANNITKKVMALVKLQQTKQVYVLNTSKKRNEIITANEVEGVVLTFHPFDKIATHPMNLIGKFCTKYIAKGKTVKLEYLKNKPEIIKKETVNVTIKSDNFLMEIKAKACQNGWLGQKIKLKNIDSKKTFTAQVTGKNKAEICLGR